jgi:hypothetical protein
VRSIEVSGWVSVSELVRVSGLARASVVVGLDEKCGHREKKSMRISKMKVAYMYDAMKLLLLRPSNFAVP